MQRIRAAICRDFNAPLTIEDVLIGRPGQGQVEITIEAVAICHSDITFWRGGFGGPLPAVYGHEAAGRVTALGPGTAGLAIGQRVCVTLIRACGHCRCCASGAPTACETPVDTLAASPLQLPDGTKVVQAMATAGFAEKVVVDQSQVAAVPDTISPEAASLISCGVITGIGAAVYGAGLRPGEDAVVIGAGGVGLNAIQGARIAGARRIVAVDTQPEKLKAALEFGATDTVMADEAPWKKVHQILGRGADAVLVTVGAGPVYDHAPEYLARRGRVVMVGLPHGDSISTYSPLLMADASQALQGSRMGSVVIRRDIPWIVDLYLQGRLKLDELISGRFPLDQINEAIADALAGTARRNVIVMQ